MEKKNQTIGGDGSVVVRQALPLNRKWSESRRKALYPARVGRWNASSRKLKGGIVCVVDCRMVRLRTAGGEGQ